MSWKCCFFLFLYLLRKTGDGPQMSEKVDRFGQVSDVVVGGQGQPSLRQCTKMLLLLELREMPTPRTRKIIVPRSVIEPNSTRNTRISVIELNLLGKWKKIMCIRFQSKKLYRPFWNDITMTCKFDWKRVEAFPSSIVAHQLTTNIKCSAGSVVFPRFSL